MTEISRFMARILLSGILACQAGHGSTRSSFLFVYNNIIKSGNLLLDDRMLLFNREGSFRTESVPDGKLLASNHRQFRCYCPLWPSRVMVQQESIPWQSFVFDASLVITIRNTSLGPCTTGIPARVFKGLGDGDFHF